MAHTPGPWRVEEDEDGLYIRMEAYRGQDEYLVVYASPIPEQREADAHLIAAAPELLAACKAVLSDVSLDVYRGAAADRGRMTPAEAAFALLRAAIARANGG